MNAHARPAPDLAARLVAGMTPLADRLSGRDGGPAPADRYVSTYCALRRERIRQVETRHPLICVVMSGSKEIWIGERDEVAPAGSLLILPAGVRMDIVNLPDPVTGLYESVIVEVAELPQMVAPPPPRRGQAGLSVRLTPDLVEAVIHAAGTVLKDAQSQALCTHRLAEVLLLLRDAPAAAVLFDRSVAGRVAQKVASDAARSWTVAGIARELNLGASTLRRRLAEEGTSFRQVVTAARMDSARQLLLSGRASVAEAALIAGYASRSHFARRFRERFGTLPRDAA